MFDFAVTMESGKQISEHNSLFLIKKNIRIELYIPGCYLKKYIKNFDT